MRWETGISMTTIQLQRNPFDPRAYGQKAFLAPLSLTPAPAPRFGLGPADASH